MGSERGRTTVFAGSLMIWDPNGLAGADSLRFTDIDALAEAHRSGDVPPGFQSVSEIEVGGAHVEHRTYTLRVGRGTDFVGDVVECRHHVAHAVNREDEELALFTAVLARGTFTGSIRRGNNKGGCLGCAIASG